MECFSIDKEGKLQSTQHDCELERINATVTLDTGEILLEEDNEDELEIQGGRSIIPECSRRVDNIPENNNPSNSSCNENLITQSTQQGSRSVMINATVSLNIGGAFLPEQVDDAPIIIDAEKYSLLKILKQYRAIKWVVLFCTIAVITACVINLLVFLIEPDEDSQIRTIAIEISGEDILKIPDSPQSKALWWMENVDQIQIPIHHKFRFIQRYVSAVIYFTTGGPTTWLSEIVYLDGIVNECEWNECSILLNCSFPPENYIYSKGNHCRDNKSISDLNFYHSNMSGIIPREIEFLSNLNVLNFGGNWQMQGTIPSTVGKLTSLKRLFLFDMNLSGVIPHQVQYIKNLEAVSLYGNRGLSGDMKSLCSIPSLLFFQTDCGNGTSKPACSCCSDCCNPDLRVCCNRANYNCYTTDPDKSGWFSNKTNT